MVNETIRTENLTKRYNDLTAVSGISITVRKGEIYGFLGLNGAGKTTTIRMLLGMIKPNSGAAFINGEKIENSNQHIWKNVGYLVEVPYSYPNLTVRENLEITRQMRQLKDKKCIDEVISKLKLGAYENRLAKNLSLGNAQRLGLAKALIHKPDILILDEPSNGLDPAGIYEIREFLKDMALNHGVTIFISSHILGEIARLATRIGIIHQGLLVQEFDSQKLELLCQKTLRVNTKDNNLAEKILNRNGYFFTPGPDHVLECSHPETVNNPELIATLLVNQGCPPTMLMVRDEDLESYFLRTIGLNGGEK